MVVCEISLIMFIVSSCATSIKQNDKVELKEIKEKKNNI